MNKEKITYKQYANLLFNFCIKNSGNVFYEEILPELKAFNLSDDQKNILKNEIIIIDLWAISKALNSDKKLVDEINKNFILARYATLNEKKEKDIELLKEIQELIYKRFIKYYKDWDDKSGTNQSVLALTMLEQMLNEGKSDRKLINIHLFFLISNHIFSLMQFTIQERNKLNLVES